MKKMAVIFVSGLEKNPAKVVKLTSDAVLGAYRKIGMFGKKEFDIVPVHVIDVQTLWALLQAAQKFGMKHFVSGDINNLNSETILVVGPEEPDRLNKLSPNLRLFSE